MRCGIGARTIPASGFRRDRTCDAEPNCTGPASGRLRIHRRRRAFSHARIVIISCLEKAQPTGGVCPDAVFVALFCFLREGCVCPIGSTQNIVLSIFDKDYAVPLVVLAFFLLPLLFTLFFGRTFCAGVCPLGAIQDLVLLRPAKVPRWAESALRLIAYVYLGGRFCLRRPAVLF